MSFTIARSLADALRAMERGARPIAGGSDLVVSARQGAKPLPSKLVAIDRIPELCKIDVGRSGCSIGASVTHATLIMDRVIVERYTALADASALVGSPATRNVGTLGGNLMNGSPAMDTGAPLVVLGATVELRTQLQARIVQVRDLWVGPGKTIAAPNELCTTINLPVRGARSGSAYVRLEYRRAMEIAVVGAAAAIDLNDDGTVATASVALTAVGPTILCVDGLDGLAGRLVDEEMLETVAEAASEQATPISDLRASDVYRRHTVGIMAKRALDAAARRACGETIAVPVNRALGVGVST